MLTDFLPPAVLVNDRHHGADAGWLGRHRAKEQHRQYFYPCSLDAKLTKLR